MTKEFFAKTTYTYDDIEYMNRLRITQNILKTLKSNTVSSILKILSNHGYIRTNITRFSFISMFIRFKFSNIKIIFYEMPSKQDAENFMTNVYFAPLNFNLSTKDGFLEIQNASQKPKIAYNATMFLREEGFDVLDWSNSANNYKETLIKEYSGDYGYALALAKIFKTKDILIAYNGQTYYKATIFIGEDFPIEKFQTKDNIRKN
jgi:ribosomal protein S8